MARSKKIPALQQTLWLKASPAKVWAALTDAKHLTRWFTVAEKLEPRKGGRWDFTGFPGKVLLFDKGQTLSHTHTAPDKSVSRVTYRLKPGGKYTFLSMTHDRFGSSKCTRDCWEGGWPYVLSNFKTYVETGAPMWETPFKAK